MEQEVQGEREREIPEHLVNLFEKSKGELTGQNYYVNSKMCLLGMSSTWVNLMQLSMELTRGVVTQ